MRMRFKGDDKRIGLKFPLLSKVFSQLNHFYIHGVLALIFLSIIPS